MPTSLPDMDYLAPETLAQALEMKSALGAEAMWLAGGTDLVLRARQRLITPKAVISLKHLADELGQVRQEDGWLHLGAMLPLKEAALSPVVAQRLPGLKEALLSIGAETLQQRVGTIGGNLCLETRCIYYNQSAFFRSGLAPCFKLGGEVCHPGGETADRCRSVCQADGAVMLAALGAKVVLASAQGRRELELEEFYTGRGEEPLALTPDELLVEVKLPLPGAGSGSAYEKLAWRSSLDYPQLSAAAALVLEDGVVREVRLALGGAYAAPLLMKDAVGGLLGNALEDEAIAEAARKAGRHAEVFFIENQSSPAAWRREVVPVAARRALERALARAERQAEDGS